MKKNLLTIFSVFSVLILTAQDTWVTGSAPVKVMPSTMFYHGGDFNIKTATTAVVTNDGFVYVKNKNYINNQGDANRFILTYTSPTLYGQLITNQSIQNTGKLTLNRLVPTHTGAIQSAFPLASYTINDWGVDAGATVIGNTPCGLSGFCANRRKHPIFTYNDTSLVWDPIQTGATINPFKYHIVNTASVGVPGGYAGSTTSFKGIPNGISQNITVPNTSSINFGIGGANANTYGVRYRTYIDDFIDGTPTGAGQISDWTNAEAGKNQLHLSNPYTSNIDLSYIGINELGTPNDGNVLDVKAIWYYTTSRTIGGTAGTGTGGTSAVVALTNASGQFVAGDVSKVLLRPMQAFVVKGKTTFVGQSFNFNDNLKTFKQTSKASDYGANGPAGTYTNWGVEESSNVYQVELKLNDKDGEVGLGTFVTAANEYETGLATDPSNGYKDSSSCIYGLPESKNGGLNVEQYATGKQIYINKINPNFRGKSIPLGVKVGNYTEELTLKANLYDTGRKLKESEAGFIDSSAKFYFHDKKLGTYSEITPSFAYTFKETESNDNRFELFYGEIENLSSENLNTAKSGTVVYKNQSDANFYVKFAKTWNKANVKIYDISGALVSSVSNVDASVDYLLPISQSGAYVVTAVSELGEVSTSKVVK